MKLIAKNKEELSEVAQKVIKFAGERKIWLLIGDLGSGKTTFVKSVGDQLNVIDVINSPTYAIINEYETVDGMSIYHMDFYRLQSTAEAMDIGIEEYLYSGNYCFLEWPDKIQPLLPETFLQIEITIGREGARIFNLT